MGSTLGPPFGNQFCLILGIIFWCFFEMSSGWHFCRFGVHFGPILGAFFETFLEACSNLPVKRDMHEHISIYYGLAMSEPLENCLFWSLLGSFLDAF